MSLLSDNIKEQIIALQQHAREINLSPGDILIRENDISTDFYFVESGELEGLKKGSIDQFIKLATFKSGDIIGEMNALDRSARSMSVRATAPSKILILSLAKIKESVSESAYTKIVENLAKELVRRIRKTTHDQVKTFESQLEIANVRIRMGIFMCYSLIGLAVYFFSFSYFLHFTEISRSTTLTSVPVILFILSLVISFMVHAKLPLSFYGITLKNWQASLRDSLIYTPLVILAIGFLKWLLITFNSHFLNEPLFNLYDKMGIYNGLGYPNNVAILMMLVYVIFIPIQEFLARGVWQGCLQHFLVGRYSVLMSVIISNLMFAIPHAQVSLLFSIMTFVIGLFWGWLYTRQQTLLGPTISHIMISLFSFSMGFSVFFHF